MKGGERRWAGFGTGYGGDFGLPQSTAVWRRSAFTVAISLTLGIAAFVAVAFGDSFGGVNHAVRAQTGDVSVLFTADNAYGFGYGDASGMRNYFGGIENGLARDIFSCNPTYGVETYTVPAPAVDDYLYVVAWSDKAVTQGVIGQFTSGGKTIYTGIGAWEAYATGEDYRPPSAGPGPDMASINGHIAKANTATGDPARSSVAWVDEAGLGGAGAALGRLDFGEPNDVDAGNFPAMNCLDPRARWMWYNSDPATYPNTFRGGPPGGHKEFLIFRLPMREIIGPPTPPPEPGDCVCDRVRRKAPAAVVDDAIANPSRYHGWGMLLDPGKPAGPLNPLRQCLNLHHPNLAFHPLWNSVEWKVGCR
jgi:hypothetical protein